MDEERELYVATQARLTERLTKLRAEQRRLKWLAIATLVAIVPARFFSLTAAIVVTIFGASLFFVGHYVVYMHIHESKLVLAQCRKKLGRASARGA